MSGGISAQTAVPGSGPAYPAKTVRVICPNGVGDTADILARLIGMKVGERLGRQFIVDNRPGAAGQLGLELAARAAPDGYTISGAGHQSRDHAAHLLISSSVIARFGKLVRDAGLTSQ